MLYCLICTLLHADQSVPGAAHAHSLALCRHTAFQLLKLETIMNVLNMGYSALWVEPHALLAGACRPCCLARGDGACALLAACCLIRT